MHYVRESAKIQVKHGCKHVETCKCLNKQAREFCGFLKLCMAFDTDLYENLVMLYTSRLAGLSPCANLFTY